MMDCLVEECKKRGISTALGYYYPTAKNRMVKEFFGLQGFTPPSCQSPIWLRIISAISPTFFMATTCPMENFKLYKIAVFFHKTDMDAPDGVWNGILADSIAKLQESG